MTIKTIVTEDKDVIYISNYILRERQMYWKVTSILNAYYTHNPLFFLPQLKATHH